MPSPTVERFASLVPRTRPLTTWSLPPMLKWKISVQRLDALSRRWREIASWTVLSTEPDQQSLLNAGMKENWRVIVSLQAAAGAASGQGASS